jgi:hypothetical protein
MTTDHNDTDTMSVSHIFTRHTEADILKARQSLVASGWSITKDPAVSGRGWYLKAKMVTTR